MFALAKDSLLSNIANNASFLSERINSKSGAQNQISTKSQSRDEPKAPLRDRDLIERHIVHWSKLVGGTEKLAQYLQWYELDLDSVRSLIVTTDYSTSSLPSWSETLEVLITGSQNTSTELRENLDFLVSEHPLPFEDFYLPFILVARNQLKSQIFFNYSELLSQQAYGELERSLLQQLVNLGTEVLLLEFNRVKQQHSLIKQADIGIGANKSLYTSFVQNLQRDGGLEFFAGYPVLARLIATTVDLWVESTAEFITRLQNDKSAIEDTFSSESNIGIVESVDTSLANPHHGKRLVLALKFTSGITVVYKPKDLNLYVAFNQLLDWCNQQEISLPFKLSKILPCQGYGWVEYIPQEPCAAEAQINHFYHRAGMLLSLLYVLGAKNCQAENVVACGQHPVLIDADILMQPEINRSSTWFEDSVANIGFLPRWEGDINAKSSQDSSVLGNIFPHQINSSREWKFINTDDMHLARKSKVIPAGANVLTLDGKTVAPYGFEDDIARGFEEIYQLLQKHQATLVGTQTPLTQFKSAKSKFTICPTLKYAIAIKKSLSPQYLSNGFDYSLLIDILNHNHLTSYNRSHVREILTASSKSIQQQDIPDFSVACDSDALEVEPDIFIRQFFQTSSYQQLITRLQNLEQKDLDLQLKMIRLSLYAKMAHRNARNYAVDPTDDFTHYTPISSEKLIQEAIKIGDSLVKSVIGDGNDRNWLSLEYMTAAQRYQLQPLDDSLFTGRVGVCLFLAALAKVTGKSIYKDLALAATSSIVDFIDRENPQARFIQPGLGINGIGGIIYSLVKISQFLEAPELLNHAQALASLITPEIINRDRQLDIIFGVAGLIPGLVSLYQATGDQSILEIAIKCGDRLLSQQTATYPRAWITLPQVKNKSLTGLSHGASGIALSLLKLYDVTSNKAFLEAAKEGIEYESSVFDNSLKKWPDLRLSQQVNQVDAMYAWCNGSPGIGLARLGSLPTTDTQETYKDIEIALDMTQKYELFNGNSGVDYLCCGSLGRTELFVLASQKLARQDLLISARKNAALAITKAEKNQDYNLLPHLPDSSLSPSFFKGSAGLGYQFLRLANPRSLPSVLIFE